MSDKLYCTNRELLAAIHESKMKTCSYLDDHDRNQHCYVTSIAEITEARAQEVVEELAARRKDRIIITTSEVVFRLSSWSHVPLATTKAESSRAANGKGHVRVRYPPFSHYRLIDGRPVEVLRSHWEGGLHNGHFSDDVRITNRLARLMMLLVDRYARRPNFNGYSYVDEMKAAALLNLSHHGLMFDESKSDNPFSYYTTTANNAFLRILKIEKGVQGLRDDLLEEAGVSPSATRQAEHAENKVEAKPKKTGRPVKRDIRLPNPD